MKKLTALLLAVLLVFGLAGLVLLGVVGVDIGVGLRVVAHGVDAV